MAILEFPNCSCKEPRCCARCPCVRVNVRFASCDTEDVELSTYQCGINGNVMSHFDAHKSPIPKDCPGKDRGFL